MEDFTKNGRKIAYTSVDEITQNNILSVIGGTRHIFTKNKARAQYLWNYYKGEQPIKNRVKKTRSDICNKVSENHAYEIVQFKVGQTYGEPVQCVSNTDESIKNVAVEKFNNYTKNAYKHARDIESGEWQSATGTSFKAVQFMPQGADIPFRIVVPTPLDTYIVYNAYTKEPMMSVQFLKDSDGAEYTLCFTDKHQCIIRGSEVLNWQLHAYGGIPIVEYPNNPSRISDIELVEDLLDGINNIQSNRIDGIEQFIQFCMVFTNCEVDADTMKRISETGAISLKSNNGENKASFDIVERELNQQQTQIVKEDLWDNALSILSIPNKKQKNSGGDTQGAIQLRGGWDHAKASAKLKDAVIYESEKRFNNILLNVIKVRKGENDCPITSIDYTVTITHSPLDNLIIKCQALQYLLQNGIHPLIAIQTCGLWGDNEKVYMQSKPFLDSVMANITDKTEQEKKAQELLENKASE